MTTSHILFVFRALGTKSPPLCFKLLKGVGPGAHGAGQQEGGSLKPMFLSWVQLSSKSLIFHARDSKFDHQHQKANILAGQTDVLGAKVVYIH